MSKTMKPIGRVVATEKSPTTIDRFGFWTNSDLQLNTFDVVKVQHLDGSNTYGVVENISHLTDSQSFLTNYISNDFGNTNLEAPTLRIGMNYVEASVAYNDKNIYTPVHSDSPVYLANQEEISQALGLNEIENKLVCGSLKMYEDTEQELQLPVYLNSDFLIGPEGAHLNISGISGLAAKTSYAMFLLKSIQEYFINNSDEANREDIAIIIFNVKGKDLMAIDQKEDYPDKSIEEDYINLNLSTQPFSNVNYFIPYNDPKSAKTSTYLSKTEINEYINRNILKKYKYTYSTDKESIEMLLSGIDDPNQTMEAIISKIVDDTDPDFSNIETWDEFLDKISEFASKSNKNSRNQPNEISVLSWRKFKRLINKAIKNDDMFTNRIKNDNIDCRLGEELKHMESNSITVIDIAKLPEDKQAFVFGDCLRTLYNLKLGEFDEEKNVKVPSKIIIFIDELNKYASKDSPKSSPILREILDITERGRSLGVILFGAEQFRSNINQRVTGNCSTHAYGRTNSIETSTKDYSSLPKTYKNLLTRLKQGDYLIQNPIFRSLLKIKFPKPIYKQFK